MELHAIETKYILLCIFFTFIDGEPRCTALIERKMSNCGEMLSSFPNATITNYCNTSSTRVNNCKQATSTVCNKNFKISIFRQQLFVSTMRKSVREIFSNCCGNCTNCSIVQEIDDMSHFELSLENTPDIIFPVIGESSVNIINEYYFIPLFDVPHSIYFTRKKSNSQIMGEVVMACLLKWPFFLVCLLLATLSGFLIWICEMRKNISDFNNKFLFGVWDGFWWSFVSMTTVGYGDKIPRTLGGRLYAVVWILIGISMCGMFTASLTNDIMNAKTTESTDMSGRTVGVLKQRLHDIAIVAQHSGTIYESSIEKTVRGINELMLLLQNKTVDGFLIDRNSYSFFIKSLSRAKFKFISDRYDSIEVVATVKSLLGEKLNCGLLVKDKNDFEYLKSFVENNRLQSQTCNSLRMNVNAKKQLITASGVLLSVGELFEHFIYYSLAILFVIMVIGILYDKRVGCRDRTPVET